MFSFWNRHQMHMILLVLFIQAKRNRPGSWVQLWRKVLCGVSFLQFEAKIIMQNNLQLETWIARSLRCCSCQVRKQQSRKHLQGKISRPTWRADQFQMWGGILGTCPSPWPKYLCSVTQNSGDKLEPVSELTWILANPLTETPDCISAILYQTLHGMLMRCLPHSRVFHFKAIGFLCGTNEQSVWCIFGSLIWSFCSDVFRTLDCWVFVSIAWDTGAFICNVIMLFSNDLQFAEEM